jgi:hypothetical protein
MTDNPKATRLTLFLAMLNNAERFASPITPMECLIVAHLACEWIESGEVPSPEEWDRYDYEMEDAIDEAETATKN